MQRGKECGGERKASQFFGMYSERRDKCSGGTERCWECHDEGAGYFPPIGMEADLCAACGIGDDAETAEEQVKAVGSGMEGAMDGHDVYNAAEIFHRGCLMEQIKEAVANGRRSSCNRNFNAGRSLRWRRALEEVRWLCPRPRKRQTKYVLLFTNWEC